MDFKDITFKNYGKALVVGLIGSLIMFILMQLALSSGVAPFNVPPSAAMVKTLGFSAKPLALIVHFLFGAFWSLIFVLIFNKTISTTKGLIFSFIPWLIMMLIFSPIIGWGVFGTADTSNLPEALQLGTPVKYIIATLVLHLIFGVTIGYGNTKWVNFVE